MTQNPKPVRTRIAPSPTGDPHVGTAYIALFNYCFARRHQGKFILRIEDTDVARSNRQSEAMILQSLRWLGIEWDEGPDVGGPHQPYRQSERGEIYREHARILLEKGDAFRCFCTPERLAKMREEQRAAGERAAYDGLCLKLSEQEIQANIAGGKPFVIRMKVPKEGECVFQDLLRGEIRIAWNTVDMQVLLKPDGMPTYHLANVVDDHLMEISHVLRGEEWINSAPKHLLLYQYFGWEMPQLCHMPLLRNPDRSKLSKRKNPTSVLFYERMGFLPEGLVNYLGLMAWSMPSGEEKFSLPEMVENFSLERISLGGPIFDLQKLTWLNGRWIRENFDTNALAARIRKWAVNESYMHRIIPMLQQRIFVLSDLGYLALPFFTGLVEISLEQLLATKLDQDTTSVVLRLALDRIEMLNDKIEELLRGMASQMEIRLRDLLAPFYISIMGKTVSAPLFDGMELLGRDLCRARLRHALELVGKPQSADKRAWLAKLQKEAASS